MMKAIKVNADYESVLFFNKPLPKVNEALEFLAFWLDERPVITSKKYSDIYFDHVESFTGRRPETKSEGAAENWWGPLTNPELERKLNSKEMSSELTDAIIIDSFQQLPDLKNKTWLAKSPYGMSGQNMCLVEEGKTSDLKIMLKKSKVILEPLFDRKYDFSHYVFPNGVSICYENIVDKNFQYKGTVFRDYTQPDVRHLRFYSEVKDWKKFEEDLTKIKTAYSSDLGPGYSIDSFVYEDQGLHVRSLSEVNYRRTMGRVAFELSLKFGGIRKWSAFVLTKNIGMDFLELKKKLLPLEWEPDTSRGVILLSPGDVRFDMFFLSAINEEEGHLLLKEMQELLPTSSFPVLN